MKAVLLALMVLATGLAALAETPTTAACTVTLDDPETLFHCLGPPLRFLVECVVMDTCS